ncbi:unnamed protein product, partial [Allacma fusca]
MPKICQHLAKLLTPSYSAVTYKDQDYYVFLTGSTDLGTLLEQEFTKELKFKIIFQNGISGASSRAFTVCLYCHSGLSQMLPLNDLNREFVHNDNYLSDWKTTALKTILFPDFTLNAFGHELRVSAQTHLSFAYKMEENLGRWTFQRGFAKLLLEEIIFQFNYTYTLLPAKGSGTTLSNGSWIGTVGDIVNGKADIGIAIALTSSRFKFIGGNSFTYGSLRFIVGIPKSVYSWKTVHRPFNLDFWIGTIAA